MWHSKSVLWSKAQDSPKSVICVLQYRVWFLVFSRRTISSHIYINKIVSTHAQDMKTLVRLKPTSPGLLCSPSYHTAKKGNTLLPCCFVAKKDKHHNTEMRARKMKSNCGRHTEAAAGTLGFYHLWLGKLVFKT